MRSPRNRTDSLVSVAAGGALTVSIAVAYVYCLALVAGLVG